MEVTTHLQQNLDRIWKCARWIRDITTYARSREKKAGIHLSHIFRNNIITNNNCDSIDNENTLNTSSASNEANSKNIQLCHSSTVYLESSSSDSVTETDYRRNTDVCDIDEENPLSSFSINCDGTSKSNMDKEASNLCVPLPSTPSQSISLQTQVSPSPSFSVASSSSSSSSNIAPTDSTPPPPQESSYAIIKVHALYDTGLNKNVNIKLHITEQTTSRDIINLVVRHLNAMVQNKGKGVFVYSEDSLASFCLVLKFQGHKKILRDDYKLLQLKGQLQKAKVYITMLDSVFSEEQLGQASFV